MATTSTRERDRLRARLAEAPRNQQGHRQYDDGLKREVQRYARQALGEGRALTSIAGEIEISGDTLWGWLYKDSSSGPRRRSSLPERAKEFRAALAALGARSPTTPYPPELRALAVAHVKERCAQGASMREMASELGVGPDSIRRWQSGRRRRPVVVRRVAIAPRATAARTVESIVVHGPAGVRIEGMGVSAIAALFKELAS